MQEPLGYVETTYTVERERERESERERFGKLGMREIDR
jgi:hypothetical protein